MSSLLFCFTRTIVLCLVAVVLWGCADQAPLVEDTPIQSVQRALGVPQNGYPNWEERMMHVYINRARSDPAAVLAAWCAVNCPIYPVAKPLVYDYDLARASRFQSVSLHKAGAGWQEDAVCALAANLGTTFPTTCDGSPSCACQNGTAACGCQYNAAWLGKCMCPSIAAVGCPKPAARVTLFRPTFSAVAHGGGGHSGGSGDPVYLFYVFLISSSKNPERDKLIDGSYQEIGLGYSAGTGCSERFWTMDYLTPDPSKPVTIPLIPAGSHLPGAGPSGTAFDFRANYFHATAGPTKAEVVINGVCHPMTLERGTQTNGTWQLNHTLSTPSSLCAKYYFKFKDPSGTVVTYPSAGSLQVLVGSTKPCADYTSQRVTEGASCTGASDAGLDLGSDAVSPSEDLTVTSDLSPSVDNGASTDVGADQQITPADGSVTADTGAETPTDDGCSYAAASLPRASGPLVLVLLLALGLVCRMRAH